MAYTKTNWVNGSTPINATNLNKIENGISANDSAISAMLNKIYPVNSIIIRDSSTDMSKWLGFTWTKVFAGKVLVGVDSTDNDFKTVGKTGGEKTHKLTVDEMPSHSHKLYINATGTTVPAWTTRHLFEQVGLEHAAQENHLSSAGGSQPHNNLQPYQVVAYWKRTK